MQMHHKNRLVLLAIFMLIGFAGWSQNTCSDQLRLAQRRYDSGLLDDIPSLLESCIQRGFTKEEKANAYKLLIQTYIFSDQPQKADEVMLDFLREFPKYTIAPNDHTEFINLYQTYRTTPVMKIETSIGLNLGLPWVKEYFGVEDLSNIDVFYSSSFGANAEVNYIDHLFNEFDGSFGVSVSWSRVGYWNELYDHTSLAATYNNISIGFPLALRYNRSFSGINLFAKAGVEPAYLLMSSINFTRELSTGGDPYTGTEFVTSYFRRFDIRPIISVGWDFQLGDNQLMITAGMRFGTIISTTNDKRYQNDEFYQKYYFIPDDILVHQAFINISYVFSIFNPKKLL